VRFNDAQCNCYISLLSLPGIAVALGHVAFGQVADGQPAAILMTLMSLIFICLRCRLLDFFLMTKSKLCETFLFCFAFFLLSVSISSSFLSLFVKFTLVSDHNCPRQLGALFLAKDKLVN